MMTKWSPKRVLPRREAMVQLALVPVALHRIDVHEECRACPGPRLKTGLRNDKATWCRVQNNKRLKHDNLVR